MFGEKLNGPDLLEKYGERCDGRNVLIAILDTGVDPSLPGLQKSALFQIPKEWENPTGKWHLGIKPIYELYPKSLRKIVKEDWNKETWDAPHQIAKADALRQLVKHEEYIGGFSDSVLDKYEREDLACRVEFLKTVDNLEDKGPVADCIVWHDGHHWNERACIDTSFRGRLSICHPMGEFRYTGQYSKLSSRDNVCYTFRIDSSGNRLEICVPSSAHGSHVANIAAAHFAGQPELNGLAPGATIVSMMIGDNRIDSMETGTALIRAFSICAEMKVDIVNMSYGEGTDFPAKGRIIEEIQKLIDGHDVIFVASVGNSGPALSTLRSPGGTTPRVLGIGARICAGQAGTFYGVVDPKSYQIHKFLFSVDGSLGVSLSAPGAAIAGVPCYCRKFVQMMNGTSMSAPNASGAIACLLSKLRDDGIPWTSFRVRNALENTAAPFSKEQPFSCGRGVIKILDAFEYINKYARKMPPSILTDFRIRVSNGNISKRGIYIREILDSQKIQEYVVTVGPQFQELSDNELKATFFMNIVLKCSSRAVKFPRTLVLTSEEKSFIVKVNPHFVSSGECLYDEIVGLSANEPEMGPLFRVPITIIKPELVKHEDDFSYARALIAESGVPIRHFLTVPRGANICEIKIENLQRESMDQFTLHCVQLINDKCFRNTETLKNLPANSFEWTTIVPVIPNRTLEICVVRSWTRGQQGIPVSLLCRFHGIKRSNDLYLVHGAPFFPFRVEAAPLRPVEIKPTISLNSLHVPFKPIHAKIEPLGPRDLLVDGKQVHRLLLTYKINSSVTINKSAEIRLDLPGVTCYLYESPYDCIFFQLFSASKEFIGASSSFPERYTYKVERGEYTVQAQVRHPNTDQLELLNDTPLHVRLHVSPALTLDISSTPNPGQNAFKWANKTLRAGQEITLYAASLLDDKVPKTISVTGGSFMTGNLVMIADNNLRVADKTTVTYLFTEYSTRSSKALSMVTLKDKKSDFSQEDEMQENIRDIQISWLVKLKDPIAVDRLYTELISKYPTHLPLLLTKLKLLTDKKRSKKETETLNLIVTQIIEQCQPDEVLRYNGARNDFNMDKVAFKRCMDERKEAIVDSMLARCHSAIDDYLKVAKKTIPSIFRKSLGPVFSTNTTKDSDVVEEDSRLEEGKEFELQTNAIGLATSAAEENEVCTLREIDCLNNKLLCWIAADDVKALLFSAKFSVAHGYLGSACSYLHKLVDDMRTNGKDASKIELALIEVCECIGWTHIANRLRNDRLVRNRSSYRPF
ncbi:peptidase, S8/S53 family [Dictyocaulus viviparus]|uniref:Tripeptidyl-peptidase 2 n=1 Tax=Dictyocaulus viviparus TaxID=29172 RepID=A0A0D8XHI7_DICVI|nr:peptidase, S8/S53 family [Dictyocaulus viviparus]